MGNYIAFERAIYAQRGLVTYFANECALDIFTDTTERAPTFNLPPFKKYDDTSSPPSWAFVKNPLLSTPEAWRCVLGREPRCLGWRSEDFRRLEAPDFLVAAPPCLDRTQLERFHIGNEEDDRRTDVQPCVAVKVAVGSELADLRRKGFDPAFERLAARYTRRAALLIGVGNAPADFQISCSPVQSPLRLLDHLAVKLALNTISTGTMITMGRVTGNWMSWVEVSNKKLKDRSSRLVAELCGVGYEEACYALHEALDEIEALKLTTTERISPVQYTIMKIRKRTASAG
jgi:N-acetylmuramic acid 6-phosphate etherase